MVVTACWVSSIMKQLMLGLNIKEKYQKQKSGEEEKDVTAFKCVWECICDTKVSENSIRIPIECLKDTIIIFL